MELQKNKIIESSPKEIEFLRVRGFGSLLSPSLLRLSPCEALYLCKKLGIKIFSNKKSLSVSSLEKLLSKKDKYFALRYRCFEHFRAAGRICREHTMPSPYLRVYSRGIGREEERAQTIVRVCDENWKASRALLLREIAVAHFMRKELVLAFPQGKEITFLKVSKISFD